MLEERAGHGGQSKVAVKPEVAPALEVIEAEFVFELSIVVLDHPPLMGDADELLEVEVCRQRGQAVLAHLRLADRALAQQPAFFVLLAYVPSLRRCDAESQKLCTQLALRPFAPGDSLPTPFRSSPEPPR